MPKVEIYSTEHCPFCIRAKLLLKQKKVRFNELCVDKNKHLKNKMMARSKRHTVPQIFIDNKHIGGCDELYALERAGKLDKLLST